MNLRRVVSGCLAVTVVVGLSACGGSDQAANVAGDKKITVYSGRSETLVKPLLEKFQQQTGITVQVRYGTSAQMAAQLAEEGERSPADLFFSQDAGALGAVAKAGDLAALPTEVLGKVPEVYRSRAGLWVGVSGRSRVLVYNTELVPTAELPTSVFELADPAWKGKIGVAPTNGSFQSFVTALRVQHGDTKAKQFLTQLKANDPATRDGNVQIVADVDAGKLAVGLVNHYYVYELAKEQGTAPDKLKARLHFFPDGDTGALVNVAGVGVLKRSATDPDTRAFVDYLLGTEGQAYFAEQTYEYPLIAGVAAPAGLPALGSLAAPRIDLNDLDTLDATIAMIKEAGLA
ncbi:iron ABC transporter substrate-binding protein [Dactylosporangium sp. AC04546]|uniref:iron ABC transporter substrate-binding protein n=1 Tax=Dactylosporangium sp. AC04546 TaxID=2862460 RepID=UPI001EDF5AB3|nr:iron ABC transporter substrate-binding protein [Dactylosporangium sp. AC04546]WVK88893.1 iron ABC transporter substrate-binding protein [Dactylosporangium sp. AC04546]